MVSTCFNHFGYNLSKSWKQMKRSIFTKIEFGSHETKAPCSLHGVFFRRAWNGSHGDQFSRFPHSRAVFPRLSEPGRSTGELVVPHLRCFWYGFLNQMRFPEFRFILKQLNVINQWVNKVLIGSVVYPKLSDLSHIFFKVKPHHQKTPPRVMERRKSMWWASHQIGELTNQRKVT